MRIFSEILGQEALLVEPGNWVAGVFVG